MNQIANIAEDLNRSSVSRYIQLAALFRQRIESGQWPVGTRLPIIDDLASECGVARATIRQAMDLLADEGLIERFRAKGTFVVKKPQEALWCSVGTDWSGLLRPTQDAEMELLSDQADDEALHIAHDTATRAPTYRHLRRLHSRHGAPFMFADIYIAETLRSRIEEEHVHSKTALRLLAETPGVKLCSASQILTIGAADPLTASLLQIPLNAPVAHLHREAIDENGLLVLSVESTYRGDVVRFEVKLR
ncbi:GntR family transcriptional regulator [Sphingobium lignivorans]|uniref:GntR family transcriptional regulator n=1 Tax=Sphingobium lignivorans TaxID=2735886 RepID=A0ABR6NIK0_9SPHN|nr:GntR family transcriptional regulator [Sphingobium lignivorans]MBB5987109.1 GntR family transcriptional regulator [Sphingobium lignivorans]